MALFKSGLQTEASRDDADVGIVRRGGKAADPTAPIKRKARQRLLGATVIALAAVIGLPMLLDSEPRPVSRDVAIAIPSKDTPFKSEAKAPPQKAPAAAPAAAASAPAKPPDTAPTDSTVPNAPKPPVQVDPPVLKSAPKPAAADAAKAIAALEGRDPKPSEAKAGARFAVQLGAFSSESKAHELQVKLKSSGIATYTERLSTESGERIRVRAGPFATREAAEAVRAQAATHGVAGAALVPL